MDEPHGSRLCGRASYVSVGASYVGRGAVRERVRERPAWSVESLRRTLLDRERLQALGDLSQEGTLEG